MNDYGYVFGGYGIDFGIICILFSFAAAAGPRVDEKPSFVSLFKITTLQSSALILPFVRAIFLNNIKNTKFYKGLAECRLNDSPGAMHSLRMPPPKRQYIF